MEPAELPPMRPAAPDAARLGRVRRERPQENVISSIHLQPEELETFNRTAGEAQDHRRQ